MYLSRLTMGFGRHSIFRLQPYIRRGIAVFFLLFTIVDISSPHVCCEELNGLVESVAQSAAVNASIVHDSRSQPPAKPSASEEDCFCCCSHVLPSLSLNMAELDFKSPETDPQQDCLLTPPLSALYHPPRFV
jgi:hypothetical protein